MSIDFFVSGVSISFFLLIGMFGVNTKIGMLTVVCLIIIWLFVFLMVIQAKKEIAREHAAITKLGDALVDSISGVSVLRSFPLADKGVVEEIHSKLKNASDELRLSTMRKADQILVIDDGRLVQEGKHDDLINQEGIYSAFIKARERAANWKL